MSAKPSLGAGNVDIVLINDKGEEEAYSLKPTLHAAQTISRQGGGIRGAIERVANLEFDTIVFVIGLGLGYGTNSKDLKLLPDKVYRTGLTDDTGGLVERCIAYLRTLLSGGRPPPAESDESDKGEGEQATSKAVPSQGAAPPP